MIATSRAVDRCPSASRPQALQKWVSFMPSCAARTFICSTKAGSLPPTSSATATAASLAEATQIALTISSSVQLLPRLQPDLAAAHRICVLTDGDHGLHIEPPLMDRLKGQKQGHHFCNGCNGYRLIRIFFIKHRTAALIDQHSSPALHRHHPFLRRSSGRRRRRHQRCIHGGCAERRIQPPLPGMCPLPVQTTKSRAPPHRRPPISSVPFSASYLSFFAGILCASPQD